MARLPPELMSLIFDFITKDKDWTTLRSCSLISQDYLEQVRKRLFEVITLRLKSHPNPIVIRDVVRRIQGLCEFFERNPEANRYVKILEVLDSYPVYNSQWITQQKCLPRLLDSLQYVRHFTFGCEVGYLQWMHFEVDLQTSLLLLFRSSLLKTLHLSNMGSLPVSALNTCVQYLCLNNITTSRSDSFGAMGTWVEDPPSLPDANLWYLNVRTISMENTNSAWGTMLAHADKIKLIKWRCWEDAQAIDGVSFPGLIDFGRLPALKKFTIRMSYGKFGRDLMGFSQALASISRPSNMIFLEIAVLFPLQQNPHNSPDIRGHAFWVRLAEVLLMVEYRSVRKVTMELTVHEKVRSLDGMRTNSVAEFRKQMKQTLRRLLDMSSLHFKLKVQGFRHDGRE